MTELQQYRSTEPQVVTQGLNLNDGLTIGSIPLVLGASGAAVTLFSVPFTVVTMLGIVFATFFGPMILGIADRNYAYSQTIAAVTKEKYRRLPREKYRELKSATKAGHQVRIPLKKITDDKNHEKDILVINGKNFSIEGPSHLATNTQWDDTLQSALEVYSLENK